MLHTRLAALVSVVLLGPVLGACGGGDGDAGSPAGSGALDGADVAIDPQTEDVYTVGALEGEAWETFGNVSEVAFDETGTLYILDRDAAHIVVMSPTGEFVRTISQKGEGPGELAGPMGLTLLAGGRLVVFDFVKQGFQVFDTDGEFVESVTLTPEDGFPGFRLVGLPDGRLASYGGIRISMSAGGRAGGLFQSGDDPQGQPIEAFDLDGTREVLYTAWKAPPPEEEDATELKSVGMRLQLQMQKMVAFEPQLHLDVLSDGRLAIVDSIGYRVKLIRDGSVSSTLERPIAPTPVDETIRDRERERQLEALTAGGGSGGGRMMVISAGGSGSSGGSFSVDQNAITQMMEDRVNGMLFAEEIPVISRMKVDWNDRVWIERSGAMPGEEGPTDILTPDGAYLGTIDVDGLRIPAAFGPDGLVAYIEADELEVQRVRVARLADDEALEAGR